MNTLCTIEEIEQQMYNDYIYMSEKERDNFIKDYNETKTKLKEINEVMTDEMYKGVYSSEEECLVIRKYNKLHKHYAKLVGWIKRTMMWK